MMEVHVNRSGCGPGDVRYVFAACRGEGEDACVIGPNEEIVVEIGDATKWGGQMALASIIAAHLNDVDFNHGCSREGKRAKAGYVLHLIERNHVCDLEPMEFINAAVEDAGVAFARERLRQHDDVPF